MAPQAPTPLPRISSFGELCTRLGLFQPNPGPGYRLLGNDERLRDGDDGLHNWSTAEWFSTGYCESGRCSVRFAQGINGFLPGHLQYVAFRRRVA